MGCPCMHYALGAIRIRAKGGVWGPLAIWPLVIWLLLMAIAYWLWLLAIGYGYWVSVMGMVIDYMDRDRFGLLECGVRTSFMWV